MPSPRLVLAVTLAALTGGLVAACGSDDDDGGSSESASSDEPVAANIAVSYWVGDAPVLVADELGLDEEQGIDLQVKILADLSEFAAAWASGDVDAVVNLPDLTGQLLSARPGKTVAVANKSDGADKVVGTVDSLEDLPGHKFAFQTSDYTSSFVVPALEEAGVSMDDIELVPLDYNDGPPALASGRVDATASYEPLVTNALKDTDGVNVLYSTAEADHIIESIIVSEEFAEDPDAVEALLNAYQAGVDELIDNPEEAEAAAAKATDSSLKDFQIAYEGVEIYDLEESQELLDSGAYMDAVHTHLDTLESVDYIEDAAGTATVIEDSIDPSFGAAALESEE